jgi:plastocyanin
LAGVLACALGGLGCPAPAFAPADGGARTAEIERAAGHQPIEIRADGRRFTPGRALARVGWPVEWVNIDTETHTITSGASSRVADHPGALFDRRVLPGERFDFRFDRPGVYPYFCRLHEGAPMLGRVDVEP